MAAIRSKDTKPERVLRKALHARGFRYRLNVKDITGKPDLVFPKYGAVVFVHGCFWHRHEGCRHATNPASNEKYWQDKFAANMVRDRTVAEALADIDWRVATVWECALRKAAHIEVTADTVAKWLRSNEKNLEIGEENLEE